MKIFKVIYGSLFRCLMSMSKRGSGGENNERCDNRN